MPPLFGAVMKRRKPSFVGVHFKKVFNRGDLKVIEDRVYRHVGLFPQPVRNEYDVSEIEKPYKWKITLFVYLPDGGRANAEVNVLNAISINELNSYLGKQFDELFEENPDYVSFGYLAIVVGTANKG